MKAKINVIMMLAVVLMAACSSDDEPTTVTPAEEVANRYTGYSVSEHQYSQIPKAIPGENLTITANTDGTCNVVFESSANGKFTVNNATVTSSNNVYRITGSGTTVMGMSTTTEYDCTLEGTISSDKNTVSLAFKAAPMGGITVTFTAGDAPVNLIVAGSYTGDLSLMVQEQDLGTTADHNLTIQQQEDGTATITLAGFSVTVAGRPMALGDVVVTGVDFTAENQSYTVNMTEVTATSGVLTLSGSLVGTITDGKADITFTLRPGAMPMDIIATFTSN